MAVIKKIKDSSGTTHDIIDTKNTAGAEPTNSKVYVIGATEQSANPITYTNEKCYIGTDNCLYSNGVKVATVSDIKDNDTKTTAGTTSVPTNDGKASFYLVGTKNNGVPYAQTYVNNSVYVDVINGNILYVPNIRTSGNILCDGMINANNFQTTGGISCNYFSSGEVIVDRILNTTKIVDEATNTPIITLGEQGRGGTYVGNISTNGIITASAFYESSDERLKTFTEDYNINLDDIKNIKTGRFYWNSDENQVINGGVSAQTVEKYFPELVRENENGIKSVNYDGLAVVAIAAIKKLTERIEELENIVYNK